MQVVLRCRPLSDAEKRDGRKSIVRVDQEAKQVMLMTAGADTRDFAFDAVFGPTSTQNQVGM